MKRNLALFLAILMAISLLAGCANGPASTDPASTTGTAGTSTAPDATGPDAEVVVWFMPWYDGFDSVFTTDIPADLKEKCPDIRIKPEMLTWDGGPEKITVAIATGATPDILLDGSARITPAIQAGLTAPLNDLADELSPILLDGVLNDYTVDGNVMGITAAGSNGYNFAVNATLAQELGVYDLLPADKIHWSYDDFLNFCRKATEAGKSQGVYATQLYAGSRSSDAAYFSFLMTGGADILSEPHDKVALNSPEAQKALDVLGTLLKEKLVPDGAAITKDEEVGNSFFSKKLVLMLCSAGAQTAITVNKRIESGELTAPFDVEFVQYPTPDGKSEPRVVNWGTSAFIVFKNENDADKIEASKRIISAYLSSPKYSEATALGVGYPPVVNNANVDYGSERINELAATAAELNVKFSTSGMGILESWWTQLREVFYPELQSFYTGQKTAEQALGDFAKAGDEIIAQASK